MSKSFLYIGGGSLSMQKSEEVKEESETKELDEEIEETEREIEGLDCRIETHKKRLKDIIKRLAELYEKKFIQDGKSVNTICSVICKRFPDKENIRSIPARNLEPKYKRPYSTPETILTRPASNKEAEEAAKNVTKVTNEPEEAAILHNGYCKTLDELSILDGHRLGSHGVQDILERVNNVKDNLEIWCNTNKVAYTETKKDRL
jgi:septal ring factor EnvC (AmiA/AmiB activator)